MTETLDPRRVRARAGELASTFRVYARAWVIDSRRRGAEEARERIERKFGGRLPDDAVRVVTDDEGGVVTYVVETNVWTVVAEWKHRHQAEAWADLIAKERGLDREKEMEVVGRNSRREHVLRSFGQLKLPEHD